MRKRDITKLCNIAKHQGKTLEKWLNDFGYRLVDYFDVDDIQGYVAECEEGQVLIFRESACISKEPLDWVRNFMAWEKEYEGKTYHAGYLTVFLRNFDVFMDKITDLDLVIGGFSLGGGMSEVVANVLADTTGFRPWFANVDGAAVVKKNGYKNGVYIINSNSVVPLATLPLGFKHFGDLVYFCFRGKAYINPGRLLRKLDFIVQTVIDVYEFKRGIIDLEHCINKINEYWHKNRKKIDKIL
jgi:hypothetical protein